jgi:hypothetical protein
MQHILNGFMKRAEEKKERNYIPAIAAGALGAMGLALATPYTKHTNLGHTDIRRKLFNPINDVGNRALNTLHKHFPGRKYYHGTNVDNFKGILQEGGLKSRNLKAGVPIEGAERAAIKNQLHVSRMNPRKLNQRHTNRIHGAAENRAVFLGSSARTPLYYSRRSGSQSYGLQKGKEVVFQFKKNIEKRPGYMLHTTHGSAGHEHTVLNKVPFKRHLDAVYTSAPNAARVKQDLTDAGMGHIPVKSIHRLRGQALVENVANAAAATLTSTPVAIPATVVAYRHYKGHEKKALSPLTLMFSNPKRIEGALEAHVNDADKAGMFNALNKKWADREYANIQKSLNSEKGTQQVLEDLSMSWLIAAPTMVETTLPLVINHEYGLAAASMAGALGTGYAVQHGLSKQYRSEAKKTLSKYTKDEINEMIIKKLRKSYNLGSSWTPKKLV